jgi:hypothetical protein
MSLQSVQKVFLFNSLENKTILNSYTSYAMCGKIQGAPENLTVFK